MSLYYTDDAVTLHHGHALEVLRTLPDQSVNCVVTSPPYFGLRDYGTPDQIGLEESPAAYITALRDVFAEVRRVLADDGTLWLNLGDSYSSSACNNGGYSAKSGLRDGNVSDHEKGRIANDATRSRRLVPDVPAKNLLGIPWRVAFALQDDGWTLRNDIIWAKPNAMPESVRDRLSTKHEHVFLLSKAARYWFDLDPIREAHVTGDRPILERDFTQKRGQWAEGSGGNHRSSGPEGVGRNEAGRNPGDVWTIPTSPFPGAHFAVMAPELARRCVLAGCPEGGTVLDPFSGVGTTGMVATANGRRYIGIDNNAKTLALSLETRLAQGALIEEAL